jgi:uncharacterized membrane protein YhiD involved in acid resistance
MLGGILLKIFVGVAIGAAAAGTAVVVYNIITKSNIVDKIREKIREKLKKQNKDENEIEEKMDRILRGEIKKKAEHSVDVDVFFARYRKPETITIDADGISDDIHVGDVIYV